MGTINEVLKQSFQNFIAKIIGNHDISSMGDGTITGAIKSVKDEAEEVGNVGDLTTNDKSSAVAAINEMVAKEAAFETAQAAETEAAWDGINRIMLPGRDLTVVFADEIAELLRRVGVDPGKAQRS
jgi:hypothetical protein